MLRAMVGLLRAAVLLAGLALPAAAQTFSITSNGPRPLDPTEAFKLSVGEPVDGQVQVQWKVADGYYLYRDSISAETAAGPIPVTTPEGTPKDDPTFGNVEVYYREANATLTQAGGEVTLHWQGCKEDGICYAPSSTTLDLPALATFASGDGLIAGIASKGGAALVLVAFFGFGLLLAFTPCVFPMFPILAGMLVRQGEQLTARRGAALAAAYVVAMASAFALLGAVAGWSGQNLQIVLQSPLAIGAVTAIFVALALSSFGLFELRLPAAFTNRIAGASTRRGTLGGAAALGFTSALIVGPCVTAPLAGALLYIAQTGDAALGAAALFALGLGKGVPLFLMGIFGGKILPHAGAWMERTRQAFGFVFLALAVWLGSRLLPGAPTLALWALYLASVAVFLATSAPLAPLRLGGTALAALGAAIFAVGAAAGATDPLRPLAPYMQIAPVAELPFTTVSDVTQLEAALRASDGTPAMIYVTADWCVICRGIERSVWPDAQVADALEGVKLIKADVTKIDEDGQALLTRIGAAGPPTVAFLDAAGVEPDATRLTGAFSSASLIDSARRVTRDE